MQFQHLISRYGMRMAHTDTEELDGLLDALDSACQATLTQRNAKALSNIYEMLAALGKAPDSDTPEKIVDAVLAVLIETREAPLTSDPVLSNGWKNVSGGWLADTTAGKTGGINTGFATITSGFWAGSQT